MANFTALYDACVLYPAPLRDILVRAARTGLFRAKWTDEIHQEWIRNLLLKRPDLKPEQLERTCQLMNEHVPDSVVTGYESLTTGLDLPDPKDRHVLAAAVRAGASVIVTFNLKDFPKECLYPYRIEAQHPDEFLSHLFDLSPWAMCEIVREQREDLTNPPLSALDLLKVLEKQGLPATVSLLKEMVDLI